ncbi:MAG: twin-arginine translocase TatA/TatE family subunit [Nitrososphaeraceae archaeon]
MVFSSMEMNIGGAEWFIIAFVIIILFFGSKNLPTFSKTIGRAMAEYEKAKIGIEKEMSSTNIPVIGPKISPISSEREKLEIIAKSLGIEYQNLSDDTLRDTVSRKMQDAG